ncbi:MAG: MqnA/MqnD/SBP family protein [Thermomicrobiales bacterium]
MTRLLIHDTLATAPYALPLREGWRTIDLPAETRPGVVAADLTDDDAALVPAGELLYLHETHRVVPDHAVVCGRMGTIVMRVPVRPDEIEQTPVVLYETSATAELLARATLQAFYGIVPSGWTTEPDPDSQAVVVEGIRVLEEPEAGFVEDLCRAWLILTDAPVVTHVLVAPLAWDEDRLAPVVAALATLRESGHHRRRDVRKVLAQGAEIDRDELADLLNGQRYTLEEPDRRALLMLLQLGTRGTDLPKVPLLLYPGDEPPEPEAREQDQENAS